MHAQLKAEDEERLTLLKTREEVGKDGILSRAQEDGMTTCRSQANYTEMRRKEEVRCSYLCMKGSGGRMVKGCYTHCPLFSLGSHKEGKGRGLM